WGASQYLPRRGEVGPAPVVFARDVHDALDERGVRRRERPAVEANVVFEAGAAMAALFERPVIERDLILADAGAGPGGVGGEPLERRHVKVERRAVDRHG